MTKMDPIACPLAQLVPLSPFPATWEGVIKIQLPIGGNAGVLTAMAYDETRKLNFIFQAQPDLTAFIEADPLWGGVRKTFAHVKIDGDTMTVLGRKEGVNW